jgi:hypothetical protein
MPNEIVCNQINDSTQQGDSSAAHPGLASRLFGEAYNELFGQPAAKDCNKPAAKTEFISTVPQKDPSEASHLTMVSPYGAPVLFVMPKINW